MDRRTFIDAGAGAGLLSALTLAQSSPLSGLTGPLTGGPVAAPEDLDEYLDTVDRGLDTIAEGDMATFLPGDERSLGDQTSLARGALRALYLTGMIGDLPLEMQVDRRVQDRLWRMAPEVNESVTSMLSHLDEVTSSEWVDLQETLRRPTNPGVAIAEALTRKGALAGMSRKRRLQTRAMITHIALRLRSQPPDGLVQEYKDKVSRVMDSDGFDAMARRNLAAELGEQAFWDLSGRQEPEGGTPAGIKTLGWGVAITGAGTVIVLAGAFPGVFVMTVGVIVMLVGLIQLIVYVLS